MFIIIFFSFFLYIHSLHFTSLLIFPFCSFINVFIPSSFVPPFIFLYFCREFFSFPLFFSFVRSLYFYLRYLLSLFPSHFFYFFTFIFTYIFLLQTNSIYQFISQFLLPLLNNLFTSPQFIIYFYSLYSVFRRNLDSSPFFNFLVFSSPIYF